ncbi:hypothetical protein CALCODRAFT_111312 [Calocera cornea HHB12733]|uniref:Uncharacterized protein n=1 Tax=Calocera cornea HHB12733 TaxID=1353952 RepID=A0A165D1V6_9BASI|nr:hypothetical protein CALCODRAFT_111312 [Calocera cornea HHB12733]
MADAVLLLLLLFALCAPSTFGQDACSVIPTLFNNDKGQTPCQVYSELMNAPQCSGIGALTVPPEPVPTTFGSYQAPNVLDCWCSTVAYYIFSACSTCQGQASLSWDEYSAQCTAGSIGITVGSFPGTLPEGTSIPAWAMLDAIGNFSLPVIEEVVSFSYPDTNPTSTFPVNPLSLSSVTTSSPTLSGSSPANSSAPFTSGSATAPPIGAPSHGVVTYASLPPTTWPQPFTWSEGSEPTILPTSQPSARQSMSLKPIVGGAVGGACAILISLACLHYLLWRRKRYAADKYRISLGGAGLSAPIPWMPRPDEAPFSSYRVSLSGSTSPMPTSANRPRGETPPPEYTDLSRRATTVTSSAEHLTQPSPASTSSSGRSREKVVGRTNRSPRHIYPPLVNIPPTPS